MERIKEVAGLIGDLATQYPKYEYYNLKEVEEIVTFMKNSNDQDANSIADWIISCISSTQNTPA